MFVKIKGLKTLDGVVVVKERIFNFVHAGSPILMSPEKIEYGALAQCRAEIKKLWTKTNIAPGEMTVYVDPTAWHDITWDGYVCELAPSAGISRDLLEPKHLAEMLGVREVIVCPNVRLT